MHAKASASPHNRIALSLYFYDENIDVDSVSLNLHCIVLKIEETFILIDILYLCLISDEIMEIFETNHLLLTAFRRIAW